jgi:hypothetical protein
MPATASCFGSEQVPSPGAPEVTLDRFPCDLGDRALASSCLVAQSHVKVIREFHCGAFHGMPAYLTRPAGVQQTRDRVASQLEFLSVVRRSRGAINYAGTYVNRIKSSAIESLATRWSGGRGPAKNG